MSTLRTIVAVVAALAAGFAIATWLADDGEPPFAGEHAAAPGVASVRSPQPGASGGRADAGSATELAARLASVEAQLRAELEHRATLEARVDELDAQVAALELAARGLPPTGAVAGEEGAPGERRGPRARFGGDAESRQPLAERLVAAGFSTDRAAWIEQRVAQLPMEMLQAQYEARRTGTWDGPFAFGADQALRAELGDADYERYLQAVGRPTSVAVRNVLASSPAEQARLQPGDEIVAYDGERVFDSRDLTRLTMRGEPGQPVLVDVLRNGQRMQVVLPRGPVGITGGGRFARP